MVGKILLLLTLAIGLATPLAAQQAPEQIAEPDLEKAQALIAQGNAAQAFEMLAPFEPQFAGDLEYDYLLARSALESGQPSLASFIYERILTAEPNYVAVLIENGRAYLELGNYARAQQEFETVLQFENLPTDLRQTAEQYARITQERETPKTTFFSNYAEYGFGYDNNINSALSEAAVELSGGLTLQLDRLSRKLGDSYHALSAGTEVLHALDTNWQVFGGVDYVGRLHGSETFFDSHDLEGRAGVGYATGAHAFRLSGRYGRFFFDDEELRDVAGGSLSWRHALDERNQVTANASYAAFRFDNESLKSNDFDSWGLTAGLNHGFAEGRWLASVSFTTNFEEAVGERLDGDQILGGLNLSVQGAITDEIRVFASTGVQSSNYAIRNSLFDKTRHDRFYSASGGLSWTFYPNWTLRPQVSWSRNVSNIPLNQFSRVDVSLNLRASF